MASIAQINIFCWEKIEARSDLDRLKMVLDVLPDEPLMRTLEKQRRHGRDDYPIRPVWNSIIAGIVYQHISIESLRRELLRNGELRAQCGFDPLGGADAVPPSWAYTRFLKSLSSVSHLVEEIFEQLVEMIRHQLPDFGHLLAGDSKAVSSAGKPSTKKDDGRRETTADYGKKTYAGKNADGTLWQKKITWFGFKIHLLVDARSELPVAYEVTKASTSDSTQILPLLEQLEEKHPAVVARSEYLTLDRGYDAAKNNQKILDDYGIKPLIDNRLLWKDGETTKYFEHKSLDRIVYDEKGTVFCVHPSTTDARKEELTPLVFYGFEPTRQTLKYRCPAAVYGYDCPCRASCGCSDYGRVVRIPLDQDRRIFVPIPRHTLKWERFYATRTAVERVNSRLDVSFMFEKHYIRGKNKMKLRVGIALIIMLALAYAAIRNNTPEQMRSLVRPLPACRAA